MAALRCFFIERRDFGLMLVAFCLNFSDAGVAARCRLRLASTFDLIWDFDFVFMRLATVLRVGATSRQRRGCEFSKRAVAVVVAAYA